MANWKILKLYSSHSYYSFTTKLLWMFPVTGLTKVTSWDFQISNLIIRKMKFPLTWDPKGMKISKRYSSYSYNSFSTKIFMHVTFDSPHKRYLLEFWNFKLHFYFKDWMLAQWSWGNLKLYSSHCYYSFRTKLFVNVSCDRLAKSYLFGF